MIQIGWLSWICSDFLIWRDPRLSVFLNFLFQLPIAYRTEVVCVPSSIDMPPDVWRPQRCIKKRSAYRRTGNLPPCPSGAATVLVTQVTQVTRPHSACFSHFYHPGCLWGHWGHYLFKKKTQFGNKARSLLPFQSHVRTLSKPPKMSWDPLGKGSFVRLTSYYWLGLRLCTQMSPCRRWIWCKWRVSRRRANRFCHVERERQGPTLLCFSSYVKKWTSASHNYLLANYPRHPFPH